MWISKGYKGKFDLFYKDPNSKKVVKVTTGTTIEKEAELFKKNFQIPFTLYNSVLPVPASQTLPNVLLSEFIPRLFQYLSNQVSNSTLALYKTTFKDLLYYIGDIPLESLKVADIEGFKHYLAQRMQKITVNKNLSNLCSAFNIAIEKFEILEKNIMHKVEWFRVEKKIIQTLENKDIEKILPLVKNPIIKKIILTGLYSGLRLNEILTLQWKDVNYENNSILIQSKEELNYSTKNKKYRLLSLTKELKEIIGIPSLNPNAFVFAKENGFKFYKDYVSRAYKTAAIKAGLGHSKFHHLRHTFATNCIKNGVNIYHLKEILGHSSINVTSDNYLHSTITDIQESMHKLNYGIDLGKGLAI